MGLEKWRVGLIIGLLPVLMSASLAVFLVGLVLFIIPLRVSIAGVVGAITFMSFSRLYRHQSPSNLISLMPLQDSTVTIHVPSLHIYTAANSWISHVGAVDPSVPD